MIIHRGKQPVYFTHSQHQLTFSLDGSKIIGFRILFIRFFSPLTPTLKRRVFFLFCFLYAHSFGGCWLVVGSSDSSRVFRSTFFPLVRGNAFHFSEFYGFFFLILIHSSHSAPGNYCALPLLDIRFLKHSTI